MRTHLIPPPNTSSAVGAPGEHLVADRHPTARPRASQQPPRRSKADSLRLAQRLKQAIAVGAIVAFSVFGGLVATRLPALGTTASSTSTSATPTSTSTSTSTTSGGFLGQGSSGSGVSNAGSSSSSSTTPISGTSVS